MTSKEVCESFTEQCWSLTEKSMKERFEEALRQKTEIIKQLELDIKSYLARIEIVEEENRYRCAAVIQLELEAKCYEEQIKHRDEKIEVMMKLIKLISN